MGTPGVIQSEEGVPMKHEKLTLAEARKRIDEFKHLKKMEGKSGGAAVPPGHHTRVSAPKGKS
jgi:hypothetical protein